MNPGRRLKVVFMGTPAFAIPVLAALLDEAHDVIGVYTQPDRKVGRGQRVAAPAVKEFALGRGLPVFQPASLRRDETARQALVSLSPDVIVVAAYGLFLPPDILGLPRLGCLNVHPSLLPRHRGPSPVATAILDGDAVTGVTIIRLDQGMDSGPIVAQQETPLGPEETAEKLTLRLFEMGARLLVDALPKWERGDIQARPQDNAQATVTRRLSKEDGRIDWTRPAAHIARQVRAYYPWPGSFTLWRGVLLKVIEASPVSPGVQITAAPGQVVSLPGDGVGVGTGEGVLEVRRLQLEGKPVAGAAAFVQGYREIVGSTVGT